MDRGRGRGRGGRGGNRFQVYDRPPSKGSFYPEPFDPYRSRMMAAYDRFRYHDAYDRPFPPMPPAGYDDPYTDFYRRSPPRDPYYDYYERKRQV